LVNRGGEAFRGEKRKKLTRRRETHASDAKQGGERTASRGRGGGRSYSVPISKRGSLKGKPANVGRRKKGSSRGKKKKILMK